MENFKSFEELANREAAKEAGAVGRACDFNSVQGAVSDATTDNALFIGKPEQWNKFDAAQKKELITIAEDIVRKAEQEMRRPGDSDKIRQYINRALMSIIDKNKDCYADAKKELLELGVEAVSDSFHYDDYFDEKYGGVK